jgi:hypothetical protein
MVLRGEQFRRSGPSGCAYLSKQTPSSEMTGLMLGRIGMRLSCRSHIASRRLIPWTEKIGAGNAKDSRAMARERVRYVMGILGNRDRSFGLGGHAPGVHGHPRIKEHQESRNTNTGRRQIG